MAKNRFLQIRRGGRRFLSILTVCILFFLSGVDAQEREAEGNSPFWAEPLDNTIKSFVDSGVLDPLVSMTGIDPDSEEGLLLKNIAIDSFSTGGSQELQLERLSRFGDWASGSLDFNTEGHAPNRSSDARSFNDIQYRLFPFMVEVHSSSLPFGFRQQPNGESSPHTEFFYSPVRVELTGEFATIEDERWIQVRYASRTGWVQAQDAVMVGVDQHHFTLNRDLDTYVVGDLSEVTVTPVGFTHENAREIVFADQTQLIEYFDTPNSILFALGTGTSKRADRIVLFRKDTEAVDLQVSELDFWGISQDGNYLAILSDNVIRVYDLSNGEISTEIAVDLDGMDTRIRDNLTSNHAISFSPDNRLLSFLVPKDGRYSGLPIVIDLITSRSVQLDGDLFGNEMTDLVLGRGGSFVIVGKPFSAWGRIMPNPNQMTRIYLFEVSGYNAVLVGGILEPLQNSSHRFEGHLSTARVNNSDYYTLIKWDDRPEDFGSRSIVFGGSPLEVLFTLPFGERVLSRTNMDYLITYNRRGRYLRVYDNLFNSIHRARYRERFLGAGNRYSTRRAFDSNKTFTSRDVFPIIGLGSNDSAFKEYGIHQGFVDRIIGDRYVGISRVVQNTWRYSLLDLDSGTIVSDNDTGLSDSSTEFISLLSSTDMEKFFFVGRDESGSPTLVVYDAEFLVFYNHEWTSEEVAFYDSRGYVQHNNEWLTPDELQRRVSQEQSEREKLDRERSIQAESINAVGSTEIIADGGSSRTGQNVTVDRGSNRWLFSFLFLVIVAFLSYKYRTEISRMRIIQDMADRLRQYKR
jgi:hypothetical protein